MFNFKMIQNQLDDISPALSQQSNVSQPMSFPTSPVDNVPMPINKSERPPKYYKRIGDLRSVEEIPEAYRHIFSYQCFNKVQSKVMDDVLYTDTSLVISAPTGSGKTAIFELAIVQFLLKLEDLNYTGDFKIVYLAPIKALCSERFLDWHQKFSSLGLSCIEVTGDSDFNNFSQIQSFNIILTTPEKWDSITRRWKDNVKLVEVVKLFFIDEVHLLNEDRRGPVLEAVVSRMKTVQETVHLNKGLSQIRFVAVSATIPNIDDIACWLGSRNTPATFHKLGEDMRPVKLNKIVNGYPRSNTVSSFKFDLSLSYKIFPVINNYSNGKPTLIFVTTRAAVLLTAKAVQTQITVTFTEEQRNGLAENISRLVDNTLKGLVQSGIGYHHAGMAFSDRTNIENLFRNGQLPILVATSTLSMGVNLPAHLVIIKGTTQYMQGQECRYPDTTLLQMMGRAGRPQFDTSATAVIMTSNEEVAHYKKLVSGAELIESWLHKNLAEHINSEVVLGTITDLFVAMQWVRSTFLYIRAVRNPKHYGLQPGLPRDKVEKKLEDLCQVELNALSRSGLLQFDQQCGMNVSPTASGRLMARYYMRVKSMKVFKDVVGTESLEGILKVISECHEFESITLRTSDKKTLNMLNRNKGKECIRFPMPGLIQSKEKKVNCLIQATLGCLHIADQSLNLEAKRIIEIGERSSICLAEYLLLGSNNYEAVLYSLILSKCFRAGLWENSRYVSRQIPGIGPVLSGLLASAGKTSLRKLMESNPRDLERILHKAPPMGNRIIDTIAELPAFTIKIAREGNASLKICINVTNTLWVRSIKTSLLVGDSNNNVIRYESNIDKNITYRSTWERIVALKSFTSHEVFVHLISAEWVGVDIQSSITINMQNPVSNVGRSSSNCLVTKPTSVDITNRPTEKLDRQPICSINDTANQGNPEEKNYINQPYFVCAIRLASDVWTSRIDHMTKEKPSPFNSSNVFNSLKEFTYQPHKEQGKLQVAKKSDTKINNRSSDGTSELATNRINPAIIHGSSNKDLLPTDKISNETILKKVQPSKQAVEIVKTLATNRINSAIIHGSSDKDLLPTDKVTKANETILKIVQPSKQAVEIVKTSATNRINSAIIHGSSNNDLLPTDKVTKVNETILKKVQPSKQAVEIVKTKPFIEILNNTAYNGDVSTLLKQNTNTPSMVDSNIDLSSHLQKVRSVTWRDPLISPHENENKVHQRTGENNFKTIKNETIVKSIPILPSETYYNIITSFNNFSQEQNGATNRTLSDHKTTKENNFKTIKNATIVKSIPLVPSETYYNTITSFNNFSQEQNGATNQTLSDHKTTKENNFKLIDNLLTNQLVKKPLLSTPERTTNADGKNSTREVKGASPFSPWGINKFMREFFDSYVPNEDEVPVEGNTEVKLPIQNNSKWDRNSDRLTQNRGISDFVPAISQHGGMHRQSQREIISPHNMWSGDEFTNQKFDETVLTDHRVVEYNTNNFQYENAPYVDTDNRIYKSYDEGINKSFSTQKYIPVDMLFSNIDDNHIPQHSTSGEQSRPLHKTDDRFAQFEEENPYPINPYIGYSTIEENLNNYTESDTDNYVAGNAYDSQLFNNMDNYYDFNNTGEDIDDNALSYPDVEFDISTNIVNPVPLNNSQNSTIHLDNSVEYNNATPNRCFTPPKKRPKMKQTDDKQMDWFSKDLGIYSAPYTETCQNTVDKKPQKCLKRKRLLYQNEIKPLLETTSSSFAQGPATQSNSHSDIFAFKPYSKESWQKFKQNSMLAKKTKTDRMFEELDRLAEPYRIMFPNRISLKPKDSSEKNRLRSKDLEEADSSTNRSNFPGRSILPKQFK